MGELWALLDPIFQAAIYWFLFVVIRGSSGGSRQTEYVTAIIFSVFMFNYTRIAIMEGGRSIIRNKGLMLNAMFPRAMLPISEVYRGVLETIPALGVYAVFHLALRAPIGPGIVVLPLLFFAQTTMNLGLAFLFSPATVFIKDMSNLLNYIVRILLVISPVVYPVSTLPPQIRSILAFNPLFPLFSAYQAVVAGTMPSAGLVIQSLAWGAVFFVVGSWVFLRHERSLALYL
jgi:ABC-type polysaccharide/polyol phosphate export permease